MQAFSLYYLHAPSGICVETEKKGHVHTFPYEIEDPTAPQRTSAEFYQHAKEAITSGSPVRKYNVVNSEISK